ncbi:MAG TPA: hypothetical protein VIM49_03290, partial [Dermatophilaceae bacterium]
MFDPHWAGNCTTPSSYTVTGCSGTVTLFAGCGHIGKDGQLVRPAGFLPQHLQLALDGIETSL